MYEFLQSDRSNECQRNAGSVNMACDIVIGGKDS